MNAAERVKMRPASLCASSALGAGGYTFDVLVKTGDVIDGHKLSMIFGASSNDRGDIAFSAIQA